MPNNTSFKMHPEVVASLRGIIGSAEGGAKNSVVRNGNSGLTIGSIQIDLSKNSEFADKLFEAAEKAGLPEADDIDVADLELTHKQIDAGKEKRLTDFANAVVKTDEGRKLVADAESAQIRSVQSAVERACAGAAPQASAFCKSPQGQRELAAYVNQYGAKDTAKLEAYLAGKNVSLGADEHGKGGTNVRLEGELTVEGFREGYRNRTLWGRENPDAAKSRDGRVDDFNKQNPVAPASPPQSSDASEPAAPEAAERASARAPVNLLLPRDGMPADTAMASDDPDDSDPWRKPAKIELGGTVGALLEAGQTRGGRAKAVKLLQTTINDANRPAAFDWNWGKNGRIDVDGDLGPQTLAGFERAAARDGADGFARRYALAQFGDFARRLDKGIARPEDLPGTIDDTLGRIDPDAAAGFQDMLNGVRENLPAHARYKPLLRDGQIGPVTGDAFRTALYGLGRDHLVESMETAFAD